MKSGVESLRTVLANNPIDPQHQQQQGQQQDSIRTMSPEGEPDFNGSGIGQGRGSNRSSTVSSTSTTGTSATRDRSGSGSWSSFLPPSLTNKRQSGGAMSTSTPGSSVAAGRGTSVHRQGSIAESVTESIKSLGSGLGLGQLAGGLGLTGHMSGASGGGTGPYLSGRDGGQASRSRVWAWNGQDDCVAADSDARGGMESDADSTRRSTMTGAGGKFGRPAMARRTESGLKTGVKTEEASKETAALLAKIRAQQDVALERAKRMPEVEQMTQR